MNIGWLGLGAMGTPMARCAAAAGHTVTAFDIDPSRAAALAEDGVRSAGSPAEAAAGAQVLVVMVATPAQAEAALFGTDSGSASAATSMSAGSTVLMMATVGVQPVIEWAQRLAGNGIGMVDAPVSGGVRRAGTGDLLVMASGAADDLAAVKPLLSCLASSSPEVGPTVGDGQRVKLVNQLLCGVHIAAAAEALAYAEAMGLDARACWQVLRQGAAASFMLDDRGDRMTAPPPSGVSSALGIFVKDMGLVVDAAERVGAATPMAALTKSLYAAGAEAGLERADDSSLIQVFRDRRL